MRLSEDVRSRVVSCCCAAKLLTSVSAAARPSAQVVMLRTRIQISPPGALHAATECRGIAAACKASCVPRHSKVRVRFAYHDCTAELAFGRPPENEFITRHAAVAFTSKLRAVAAKKSPFSVYFIDALRRRYPRSRRDGKLRRLRALAARRQRRRVRPAGAPTRFRLDARAHQDHTRGVLRAPLVRAPRPPCLRTLVRARARIEALAHGCHWWCHGRAGARSARPGRTRERAYASDRARVVGRSRALQEVPGL